MTIEEAIKKSGTKNPLAGGSTKYAQKILTEDEELLYAVNTNFSVEGINGKLKTTEAFKIKGKLNGVVAITTKRIFFCNSVLGSTTSKEMSINNIQSVDDVSNPLTDQSTIRIKGLTEMFVFSIPRKIQQDFKDSVTKVLKNNGDNNLKYSGNNISAADEIKKYKELLDMGAISQEEFEAKKKELLNL